MLVAPALVLAGWFVTVEAGVEVAAGVLTGALTAGSDVGVVASNRSLGLFFGLVVY